jgi:lipoate-protein ligase A
VANISEFLREPLDVDELRARILESLFATRDLARIPQIVLTDADWSAVHDLVASKYATWAWNYGENPKSNVQRSRRFAAGEIDVRLDVQEGRITSARIFGDFMGRLDVRDVEERLIGLPYERAAIDEALGALEISDYVGPVERSDVLELLSP